MSSQSDSTLVWDGRPPRAFEIAVEDEALDDLRRRLRATRWPDRAPGDPWRFGTDVAYLEALCTYWAEDYDWRAQEAALNGLDNRKVTIAGHDLHYAHVPGEAPDAPPLLLAHGWPGSFYEYHRLIPRLTRPSEFGGRAEDSFTVVAPSLPGYGFSFTPGQRRFGLRDATDILAVLMTDVLGHDRFFAHGQDFGSYVAAHLGNAHTDKTRGIHVTLMALPRVLPELAEPTEDEARYRAQLAHWLTEETGYVQIMGTKPQTLSFGLTDSPAGLASWIVEKWRSWSDCKGDVDAHFGRDTLLTNIMIYWITGAIGSSAWPYYQRTREPWIISEDEPVTMPTAYVEHPFEILTPPRSLAETMYTNIQRWTVRESGGHFAALEDPDWLAADISSFFGSLR